MTQHDPDELRDPDLDDLPDELRLHDGPFVIRGVDEDGNVYEAPVTREHLASSFADRRRLEADADQA
jgi:hypothetical protein